MRPTSFSATLLFVLSSLLLSYAVLSSDLSSAYPDPSTASCGPVDDLTVVRREEFDGGRIIDISHVYREDMPCWKKAEEGLGQFLWLSTSIKNGSGANSSWMKMPTHTGTHVDAPGHYFDHYFDAGFDVDTLDLAVLNAILLFLFSSLLLSYAVLSSSLSSAYPDPSTATCGPVDDLTVVRREEFDDGRIIDISHVYREDMPCWEKPDEGLGQFLWLPISMKNGSRANNSFMKMPTHTGTHVDAPGHVFDHYFDAGFDVDTLDLAVLNGPALLVDVPRDKNLTADVMESLKIPKGVRRVLFRTLNTDRDLMSIREFVTDYVGFMKDGAQWLVDNTDIKLVGIDYLSVAAFDDLLPSHHAFLISREIILVEALKLDNVKPGIYTLHCLPLRLRGAEGSPIRCILIK